MYNWAVLDHQHSANVNQAHKQCLLYFVWQHKAQTAGKKCFTLTYLHLPTELAATECLAFLKVITKLLTQVDKKKWWTSFQSYFNFLLENIVFPKCWQIALLYQHLGDLQELLSPEYSCKHLKLITSFHSKQQKYMCCSKQGSYGINENNLVRVVANWNSAPHVKNALYIVSTVPALQSLKMSYWLKFTYI